MLNRRKSLLKIEKRVRNGHHIIKIRALNKSIRFYYAEKRRLKVRCVADGASGNIWRAVGVAKDLNPDTIPANLTLGGASVDPQDVAGAFAKHFSDKVRYKCRALLLSKIF